MLSSSRSGPGPQQYCTNTPEHLCHRSHGHQVHMRSISAYSGQNELGKKSKKKPSVLTNFRFLVNFIRHTGPMVTMVTRCTGSLSQLLVVEMSWGKKSKKKPSVLFHFVFWSMSSDTLVPWSPWSPGAQAAYLSFQWSK